MEQNSTGSKDKSAVELSEAIFKMIEESTDNSGVALEALLSLATTFLFQYSAYDGSQEAEDFLGGSVSAFADDLESRVNYVKGRLREEAEASSHL